MLFFPAVFRQSKSLLLLWAVIFLAPGTGDAVFASGYLKLKSGEEIKGQVYDYDEFTLIVLKDSGEQVKVPRVDVGEESRQQQGNHPYRKWEELIYEKKLSSSEDPPRKMLAARLIQRQASEPPHGIQVEAQTLKLMMDTDQRYADIYRIVYQHGADRYEMEYNREKDLLVRGRYKPGRGMATRIIGPRGSGLEMLETACRGRVKEQESWLSDLHSSKRAPMMKKRTVRMKEQSSKQTEKQRRTLW